MAVMTTSMMPPALQAHFNQKILSTPTQRNIHSLFAMSFTKPSRTGDIERFKRYNELPTALIPLGNTGETPAPVTVDALYIDAKIQRYGQWMSVNEQIDLNSQDPVLNSFSRLFGMSLRKTEDQLVRNMLAASATKINCTAGVNGNIPTEVTSSDIEKAVQTLRGNDAVFVSEYIEGENKFGSSPVRNSFMVMCSTDLETDLRSAGLIDVSQYPSQKNILGAEIGSIGGARFTVSSGGSVEVGAGALAGTDAYNMFFTGMESYTKVEQAQAGSEFIYRPAYYNDPLAQNYTLGWKMSHASRILNDLWILRLYCTLA